MKDNGTIYHDKHQAPFAMTSSTSILYDQRHVRLKEWLTSLPTAIGPLPIYMTGPAMSGSKRHHIPLTVTSMRPILQWQALCPFVWKAFGPFCHDKDHVPFDNDKHITFGRNKHQAQLILSNIMPFCHDKHQAHLPWQTSCPFYYGKHVHFIMANIVSILLWQTSCPFYYGKQHVHFIMANIVYILS